jgi:hypothetical protein
MTPADAVGMGVVGDIARPVVGVIATALLVWRDYRAVRDRLIGGALLLIGVLCLGHDDQLMIPGAIFLVATFVQWFLRQPRGRVARTHAQAPAK